MRPSGCSEKSLLEHYGALFNAVEINSSFYRPHRLSTYQRWSASVPEDFRFAVKVPRRMTHERRLVACDDEIVAFIRGVRGLGVNLGALLVQLPPGHVFEEIVARVFFQLLRIETTVLIACEPRNPSWFTTGATCLLDELQVTRVTADPAPPGCAFSPSDNARSTYLRLHGAPHTYYSPYSTNYLEGLSAGLTQSQEKGETWCIFDNTAAGAAWHDAQTLQRLQRRNGSAARERGTSPEAPTVPQIS
jgi:uncharacterized protein YecE (DUF72 family)